MAINVCATRCKNTVIMPLELNLHRMVNKSCLSLFEIVTNLLLFIVKGRQEKEELNRGAILLSFLIQKKYQKKNASHLMI